MRRDRRARARRSGCSSQRMFDLLVVDNLMPELTGLDLIRELHASTTPERERPQILMMTAHATVESAIEAMKLGAFDYLQKPFESRRAAGRRQPRARSPAAAHRAPLSHQRARRRVQPLRHRRPQPRGCRRSSARPKRRQVEEHGAHHGRDRHRQGDGRARDSLPQRAARDAADQGELRRDPGDAARIRAVRARAGAFTGATTSKQGQVRAGRRRHDLPRRDRRR